MEIPNSLGPMRRMLVSEYALVRVGDDWEGVRDVYDSDFTRFDTVNTPIIE